LERGAASVPTQTDDPAAARVDHDGPVTGREEKRSHKTDRLTGYPNDARKPMLEWRE
jgi:hypothetical protein